MNEYRIIMYKANWCGNCNMLTRVMDKVMPGFPQVTVESVDVDEDKVSSRGVTTIPSLHFYKDGRKVGETMGVPTPDKFRNEIMNIFGIKSE